MTDFDRKVLEWLNGADLLEKSKQVVLDRTAAGIETYRQLFEGNPKLASVINVDLSLADVVARAGRRLKDHEEPIAVLGPSSIPRLVLRSSRPSSRPPTARSAASHRSGTSAAPPAEKQVYPATASERAARVSKPTPMPKRTKTPTATKPIAAKAA